MKGIGAALACILIILSVTPGCETRGERLDFYSNVLAAFRDPPAEYRSVPFWVWNDRIMTAQIEEQLKDFKDKGIGGVFIHPRPGLITPYLSEEWFSLCAHAVETAKDLGMKIWIYDENSYPSGFAGGHVPDQMPGSTRKSLTMEKTDRLPAPSDDEPFLVLQKSAGGFTDITSSFRDNAPIEGEFAIFRLAEQSPSMWYGGFTYVDLMRREVTEKFLALTLDAYREVVGEEFGKTVLGVFQDEAHIGTAVGGPSLNYTPALFETFQKMWGYSLKTNLPSLCEETGSWRRVRHNYNATLNHLFIQGWARPYFDYCEANDLDFTGHYWEHEWPRPRLVQDNMAMAAYSHMPGIDILMNEWATGPGAQFGNARSVKEIRSVANQMGRKRTLSETFGAGGWDMTFFDQKRIGDWEYALGVNFLNQHLSYVTIKGARKRDHPLSFSAHEPWWNAYGMLADYFARLSVALSLGEQRNTILVLEPTTTAWMYYSPGRRSERLESIGREFQDFVNELESRQVEYDLGSESILKDQGRIAGKSLVLGERAYSLVVLPPGLENIDRETQALLAEYLRKGGQVLSWVGAPGFVDGEESGAPSELAGLHPNGWKSPDSESGWETLQALAPAVLDFAEPESIGGMLFHQRRILEDGELVFLVNTSAEEVSSGRFHTIGDASRTFRSCETWDPFSGEIEPFPSQYRYNRLSIDFRIPPGGSLLLCLRPNAAEKSRTPETTETSITADSGPSIQPLSPNVLILDYCDLTLGGKTERDLYFYDAQRKIFRHHGLERNPWDSAVQFKTGILDKDNFPEDSGFQAEFIFDASDRVDLDTLSCVVERPELFSVSCNGTEVLPEEGEWWLDRDFGVFAIGRLAHEGENRVTLTAKPFTIHTELETVYVRGMFDLESTDKGFRLVPLTSKTIGSWREQGMPFYADGIRYEKEFSIPSLAEGDRYLVRLGKYHGSVVEVLVNGESTGFIAFEPSELDITEALKQGTNRIGVVVYGTLKNTLGPHHNNPKPGTAWPSQFQRGAEGGLPSGSAYSVLDYGLFEDFSLILRKRIP